MRLDEIAPDLLLEMAYTRKKAEIIITGLEHPLNNHLIKLVALPNSETLPHWRHESLVWLSEIAAIRLKPTNRPANWQFYYRILFDEPFGGVEVQNTTSRLQLIRRQYGEIADLQPEAVVDHLRTFHQNFAKRCAAGTMDVAGIEQLIAEFEAANRGNDGVTYE